MNSALTVVNYAKGGIGNQLFQHVFTASLAKRLGANLYTDTNYFGFDLYGRSAVVWNLDPQAKGTTVALHCGSGCYKLMEAQI